MNATGEIDKSGRIVVPKKLRDEFNLAPGTSLEFESCPEGILLKAKAKGRGLYRKNGILVYDCGRATPPEAVDWVRLDREERMDKVSGSWKRK